MKRLSLKETLALTIFFLVVVFSALIVRPLYSFVSAELEQEAHSLENFVSEKTGMNFSYEKFSPSIVTGLRIKNIILSDADDGKRIAQIKKVIIRYSIVDFFRGRGISSIKDVVVDGFVLDVNKDNLFLKKLSEYSKKDEKDSEKQKRQSGLSSADEKKNIFLNLKNVASELPFNVYVRNVQVVYSDKDNSAAINFRKITVAYLTHSKVLQIRTSGGASYTKKGSRFSLGFSASGSIPNDFEESSVTFRITDFTNGKYSLGRLNLLLGYRKRVFDLRTIQNGYPLYLQGTFALDTAEAAVSLRTKDFKPTGIVFPRQNSNSAKKLRNLSFSVNADAKYNFFSKDFSYSSWGNFYVPDEIYSGGFKGNYSFSGNEKNISVKKMEISGPNIDVDYFGSYIFDGFKLSGELNVNALKLPNGANVSTELYIDSLEKGFMAFAPQLMLDQKALTALQLSVVPVQDSLDFSFEVSDYFHSEAENAGTIKIDGSYIGGTKYLQANVSSNGIYLDSAAQTFSYFGKNPGKSAFGFLSSYIFNGEFFVSTDFSQISYNVPYAFVANTKKDGQFFYISLDGNGSSLNLNRVDFVNNGKLVHLSGIYEKSPDGDDAFFSADLNADSIPYHFSGNFMPGIVSVNGDYGAVFDLKKSDNGKISGNLAAEGFPFSMNGSIFTLSTDTNFTYSDDDGINVRISRLEALEASGKYSFNPVLNVTGNVTKYGVFLDAISYSDKFSAIEGTSELLWNMNGSMFDSARFSAALKNPVSTEGINVSMELSNPNGDVFSVENLKNSFYLNSQFVFNNFGLSRFTAEESENNRLSATLILSGIPSNLYTGLNVEKLSVMSAGKEIDVNGSAFVEEKNLTVDNFKLAYNNISLGNISAQFDLNTFTGIAKAEFDTVLAKQTVHAPLEFSVSDTVLEEGKVLPSEFAARLSCEKISGTLFKKEFPFNLTVLHSGGVTTIYSSELQGISGTISNEGKINFSVAEGKPLQFALSGNLKSEQLDISVKNVKADVGKLFEYLDISRLKVYNGKLNGSLAISGLRADPEFLGNFSLTQADFTLPKIVSQHVFVPKTQIIFDHNKIQIPIARGYVRKPDNVVCADLNVYFDRWSFSRLESHIWNPNNAYMPGDFEIRLAHFVGDVNLDVNLAFEDHYLDVSGDVFLKKLTGSVKTKELALSPPKRNWFPRSRLKLHFGQHVTFIFDPLLRAVLVPNTVFGFKYDMSNGDMELDGELAFRSGDISYLSRNFYLKNGSMRFNSNDPTFNPLISVQAETRERDDYGNDVRIILTANNQYLLNFNAQFSSIPAKSEAEIRSLLGQIAVGDSERVSSLLFVTGDYAIQSTIGRSIENKLRDFLNFDILSVRTNVLQNALNYGLLDRTENSENSSFGFGNFFDNSTVYIGKYFGSSLYVDALMHWSYDKTKVDDKFTAGGLVFRPEFGLEIEAPFGNLRWNMAPDINGIRNDRFVSSTSVTLSWKFSF